MGVGPTNKMTYEVTPGGWASVTLAPQDELFTLNLDACVGIALYDAPDYAGLAHVTNRSDLDALDRWLAERLFPHALIAGGFPGDGLSERLAQRIAAIGTAVLHVDPPRYDLASLYVSGDGTARYDLHRLRRLSTGLEPTLVAQESFRFPGGGG